jgi:phosphatidylglycerophosphatase A
MRLARLIASGFGAGYMPTAPGTAGALLGLALGAALLAVSPAALTLGAAAVAVIGRATLAGWSSTRSRDRWSRCSAPRGGRRGLGC